MDTAICIASGPSLTQQDVDLFKNNSEVIAVNDVYKLAPWANVLYACDEDWWDHHQGVQSFRGQKYTWSASAARAWGLKQAKFEETGGNSGYQAICLAVQRGATRIVLLGYDMQRSPNGCSHFFGDHPHSLHRSSNYQRWVRNFNLLAEQLEGMGIEVVNLTRETALECFPRMTPQQYLQYQEKASALGI